MTSGSGYVLVTPVRNEEATVGRTLRSVLEQTVPPREWVIVSDGSTDGTDTIVQRAARESPVVRFLPLPARPGRSFGAVVRNTETGIGHLSVDDYGYLGLVDADVEFPANYFEELMTRFEADPELGLAGGVVIDPGVPDDRLPRNRMDVPGSVQFFRRECFEGIGGLIPVPEGGWDTLTCVMARMKGYRTRLFTDLVVRHLKPRKASSGGAVSDAWRRGVRDYAVGYHPLFETFKCVSRVKDPPVVIGSMAWWAGFCLASIRRRARVVPRAVIEYLRQEQVARLRGSGNDA